MKADQLNRSSEPREAIAYAEILKIAHEEGLKSIATELLLTPTDENGHLCIVKATVQTERGRFEGLGDADPGNVEADFAPHLIRVAETRAKARALRDAVNIGVVSFEELDGVRLDESSDPGAGAPPAARPARRAAPSVSARPRGNGQTRPPRSENGIEPMSEAQRRYLFRLVAGRGFHKEAGEEYLKDLFRVDSLLKVTKVAATKAIDELLHAAPAGASHGGAANF
jgi:hypothetical protein